MRVPTRKSEQNRLLKKHVEEVVYLTEEGLKKLKRTIEKIEADLPFLRKEVERTAELGDFSENEEYKDAKYKLRRANGRLLNAKDKLKRVEVISTANTGGVIQIGSTVTISDGEKEKTYQILGPQESDPLKGIISNISPLGQQLIGKREGETAVIETKNGSKEYMIKNVK